MKKFLKHIGLIIASTFIIANLLSYASLWAMRRGSFYKPSFLINEVKQQHFDYVILGASTGLTTLNTSVIDSINHSKGINLSMDDTNLASQYLMLEHFLSEGKTTKYCIVAPSNPSYDHVNDRLSDNDYRFLPFVNEPHVYSYYDQFREDRANRLLLSKWLPVIGVSYYNAEIFYSSLLSFVNPQRKNRFDARGNYEYPFIKFKDSVLHDFEPVKIKFKNTYLKKIKELCDSKNIQLICYLSPMMDTLVLEESSQYKIINHSDFLKNAHYFNDAIHVNSLGNRIVSAQFANDFQFFMLVNKSANGK